MLNPNKLIELPSDSKPQLIVVIDTDDEFDCSKKLKALQLPWRQCQKFIEFRKFLTSMQCPLLCCWLSNYEHPSSFKPLKGYPDNNECEIGTHLHSWVNPPLGEALSFSNMYPGNLDKTVEYEKLKCLKEQLKSSFGITPTLSKRYMRHQPEHGRETKGIRVHHWYFGMCWILFQCRWWTRF